MPGPFCVTRWLPEVQVEATQVESRRVSELAMEREAGANHDAELIGVRLAEAEAQVMETKAELSRERETKASVSLAGIRSMGCLTPLHVA